MPGGMIDKLLGAMKLSYDYDEYDEYDNLEYDETGEEIEPESEPEEKEPKEKKRFFSRKKSEPTDTQEPPVSENKKEKATKEKTTYRAKNVVPIKGGANSKSMEVCMICPKSEEHKQEIAETLLAGKAIVINMEGLDVDFAQSIVDFTSGACYAIDGDLKQISKYIFIATPEAVDLVGEFVDIKNKNENDTHTFDMSGSGFTKFNK